MWLHQLCMTELPLILFIPDMLFILQPRALHLLCTDTSADEGSFFLLPWPKGSSLLHLESYLCQSAQDWIQAYLPLVQTYGRAVAQSVTVHNTMNQSPAHVLRHWLLSSSCNIATCPSSSYWAHLQLWHPLLPSGASKYWRLKGKF